MEAGPVVVAFDEIEDGGAGLLAGEEAAAVDKLALQAAPKGLHGGASRSGVPSNSIASREKTTELAMRRRSRSSNTWSLFLTGRGATTSSVTSRLRHSNWQKLTQRRPKYAVQKSGKKPLIQRHAYGIRSFPNYRLRVTAQCGQPQK
jgi:hypothetical protein